MTKQHDELFRHLMQEASCYENLQEAARKKQGAIVEGDLKQLKMATDMEQSLVQRGNRLTAERYLLLKEVLKDYSDEITLNAFINRCVKNNRNDWLFIKKRIENAAGIIHRLNRENAMLLHTSIHFVQDLVQLFYPKDELKSGMYAADGTTSETAMHMVDYGV